MKVRTDLRLKKVASAATRKKKEHMLKAKTRCPNSAVTGAIDGTVAASRLDNMARHSL